MTSLAQALMSGLLPRQSSLANANLYANPGYRVHFPIEGHVIAVRFPQDETNISKRDIEYDVRPLMAGIPIIRNAVCAIGLHGIVDDCNIILRPAQLVIPEAPYDANAHGSAADTDGDRVLVQFVNGCAHSPVITHLLPHNQKARPRELPPKYVDRGSTKPTEVLTPGPATAAGYVFGDGSAGKTAASIDAIPGQRFIHQQVCGTHLALDSLGNVLLNFKAHPDPDVGIEEGAVTKKLVIQNEGVDQLRIEKQADGTVQIVLAESLTEKLLLQLGSILNIAKDTAEVSAAIGAASDDINVTLGGTTNATLTVGDGAKKVAIADYLQTLYNSLKTKLDAFDSHVHPTGMGPSGTPSPTIGAPAWNASIASTKVTLPDG